MVAGLLRKEAAARLESRAQRVTVIVGSFQWSRHLCAPRASFGARCSVARRQSNLDCNSYNGNGLFASAQ
ncbi:hypothetical protein DFQ01_12216 [Paenibacillus cellulosilyticus]|uniref:Uncharacterized protein n=1 Tax=Paenibacillus cellulosilyticus TaxID=375489 RepID=A0A2V2YNN6_9BACL|nr:hypothetical protein DFQ01_12216 [Paenibacillus cellulosilyticus]